MPFRYASKGFGHKHYLWIGGWVGDVGWEGGGKYADNAAENFLVKKFGLLYLSLLTQYMYTINNFAGMGPRFELELRLDSHWDT